MVKKLIYAFLFCICVSGINGCKKYYVIETTQQDGQLIFKSDDLLEQCDGYIVVDSFRVGYMNEKEPRVAWRIERKKSANTGEVSQDLPLMYGEKLPEFEIRVEPMDILPGEYNIGSDMACHFENDMRPLLVFGNFTIDSNKNLVIDRENSNN